MSYKQNNDNLNDYQIGYNFYFSRKVKDKSKSFNYFMNSATKDNFFLAQFVLSVLYYEGKVVEYSEELSYFWKQKAKENLDINYLNGMSFNNDIFALYIKIMNKQDSFFDNYSNEESSVNEAIEKEIYDCFLQIVGNFNFIQYAIFIFLNSVGMRKQRQLYHTDKNVTLEKYRANNSDYCTKAFQWLEKAASNNFVKAQVLLASHYERGQSIKKSIIKAVSWYKRAIKNGSTHAKAELAMIYLLDGEVKNTKEGINLLIEAAENGESSAQYNLGTLYFEGFELPQSYDNAYYWFDKAAKEGEEYAQYYLGVMYMNGYGVTQDMEKAKQFLECALDMGLIEAEEELKKL